MKERISISLEKESIEKLNKILKKTNGRFRNRSHVLEKAIERLAEEIENE